MTAGLRQSADSVHCRCPQPDHEVPCADQGKSFLVLDGPVSDRPKDLWIKPCVPVAVIRLLWQHIACSENLCLLKAENRLDLRAGTIWEQPGEVTSPNDPKSS